METMMTQINADNGELIVRLTSDRGPKEVHVEMISSRWLTLPQLDRLLNELQDAKAFLTAEV